MPFFSRRCRISHRGESPALTAARPLQRQAGRHRHGPPVWGAPSSAPARSPPETHGMARTRPQRPRVEEQGAGGDFTPIAEGGHPGSPKDGRQLRWPRRRGWVRSPPVVPLISGALQHLRFLPCRWGPGGGIPLLRAMPHLLLLLGSPTGSIIQGEGCWGTDGEGDGCREPAKGEKPAGGVHWGLLLPRSRNPGSLVLWAQRAPCFPSQGAEQ